MTECLMSTTNVYLHVYSTLHCERLYECELSCICEQTETEHEQCRIKALSLVFHLTAITQ